MATALARQLAQIAASSRSSLNVKAQKAAHSKSLLWDPAEAATQSYEHVYSVCVADGGFEELCRLDARFGPFAATLFSEQSRREDRTQLSAQENAELDRRVDAFLRLVGGRLRLNPAIRSLEWLIRRFRIHEYSTKALITMFLPYHAMPEFRNLLVILPDRLPTEYQFLRPYIKAVQAPPRSIFVQAAVQSSAFLSYFSEYTIETARQQQHYPALVAFWGGIMTEAINELVERARSGRKAVQAASDQELLHRLAPIFAKAMSMKKAPGLQIASYMMAVVYVAKGNFGDEIVDRFMEQVVAGWTAETVRQGIVCVGIMAQHKPSPHLSSTVTRALLKINNLADHLAAIGREKRIDRLVRGLCVALVERLSRKGDSRGLPIISKLVTSATMHEGQVVHVIKALLNAAYRLDAAVDQDGALRTALAGVLEDIQRPDTPTYEAAQRALGEVGFDVEELELKLNMTMRLPAIEVADEVEDVVAVDTAEIVQAHVEGLLIHKTSPIAANLETTPLFEEFSQAFGSIVSLQPPSPELVVQFTNLPALDHAGAFENYTYFGFFIRIWCGPFPALARAAALGVAKDRIQGVDAQFLIPYCVVALSDRSQRVRKAAAALIGAIASNTAGKPVSSTLFGKAAVMLTPTVVGELLNTVLVPSLDECVMDPDHVHSLLQSWVDDKASGRLRSQTRVQIFAFLASHVVNTPLVQVKDRLLLSLNQIKSAGSTTRTKHLLEVVKWWSGLEVNEAAKLCTEARINEKSFDTRIAETVVPSDRDGLAYLLQLAKESDQRRQFSLAVFERLRGMWPLMKSDAKLLVATEMLDLSQSTANTFAAGEASGLLQSIDLTTDILLSFLESVHSSVQTITGGQRPAKRRKTDGESEAQTQAGSEVGAALRRATFVLQLVESTVPTQQASSLFGALFSVLGELLSLRSVVGSELGYLQNSLLRSLLAMTPSYQASRSLNDDQDVSSGYGDLLVGCIQGSSSPAVQNSALLLIASLAGTAPDVVLHSVMPIFAFMGSSVLRQADDYSAHVVNQTIAEVVPPLIASLRRGHKSVVAAAAELLASFATAWEHIPDHRRDRMFESLTATLGEREFLFAVAAMLVDRYGTTTTMRRFVADLFAKFSVEVQLEAVGKILDLVDGLYGSNELSTALLRVADKNQEGDGVDAIAARQLSALPAILTNKALKSQFLDLARREDDHEAVTLRHLYSDLLGSLLLLATKLKDEESKTSKDRRLQESCGAVLASLLNLLGIGEFVKAVENMLARPNIILHQKILRALDLRIERERTHSDEARIALLGFLPHLVRILRESDDNRLKLTAIACIDQIAERHGKRDVEAVEAAAIVIGSPHCLGKTDPALQHRALLCLASLLDVPGINMVPALPSIVPLALRYLRGSLGGTPDTRLHASSLGFFAAMAEKLPYMMGPYLPELLAVCNLSAETEVGAAADMRVGFLRIVALRVDLGELLGGLAGNWGGACFCGEKATSEFLDTLHLAATQHPKPAISRNAPAFFAIARSALDLRRLAFIRGELPDDSSPNTRIVEKVEASIADTLLRVVYKLNDAAFRPIFAHLVEWAGAPPLASEMDPHSTALYRDATPTHISQAQAHRRFSVYGFFSAFFDNLKGLVAGYATYLLDDIIKTLSLTPNTPIEHALWARALAVLALCFEHDQDETWQQPARFSAIMPVLVAQLTHISDPPATDASTIPTIVALAVCVDSPTHFKDLNSALLRTLRPENPAYVRAAGVRCQQALVERLGTDWLDSLAEMLPYIGELQDDDDEGVERETRRWIERIEGVMGESLDSMLQ